MLPVAGISTAGLVAAPYGCIAVFAVGSAVPSGSTDLIAVCTVIVALLYTLTGCAGSCNIVCSIFNLLCEAVITGGGRDFSDVAAMVT